MKKTILILSSDPHGINYEIIKKSISFFDKKNNKNEYVFIEIGRASCRERV